jgi:hypothetical protein
MTWTRQQRHKAKTNRVEQAIKDELARPDTNHQRILHLAYNAWAPSTPIVRDGRVYHYHDDGWYRSR